jgi:hypothetical protein
MTLSSKIQLEIETGAGSYAIADTVLAMSPSFAPLLDIAFGGAFSLDN